MKPSAGVAIALALLGCGSATPRTNTTGPRLERAPSAETPRASKPLALVLASNACREIEGRLIALASGASGSPATDLYVLPKRCAIEPRGGGDELDLGVDAYAWLGIDRELASVRVREFVHTTLHLACRLSMTAAYAHEQLVITLTTAPSPKPVVRVESVGMLQLDATSWASLIALELAPSTGTSPESVAKRKLREEAELTLTAALERPLVVRYDGKRGTSSFGVAPEAPGGAPSSSANAAREALLFVVPRGSALVGPFEPTRRGRAARVRVVEPNHEVRVRAICASHAERLLDADRRGEQVFADAPEWITVRSDDGRKTLELAPMTSCPWLLSVRGRPDETSHVEVRVEAIEPRPEPVTSEPVESAAVERWISIDRVAVELDPSAGAVDVVLGTDARRFPIHPEKPNVLPAIVTLAPDQALTIRAIDPSTKTVRGAVTVPIAAGDRDRDLHETLAMTSLDPKDAGHPLATIRIDARLRRAPSP